MTAPRCPKDASLYHLIDHYQKEVEQAGLNEPMADQLETINALRYLLGLLQYRRAAHQKQQIKRQILIKAARELGIDNEIDAAVEMAMQKVMERQSVQDLDDELETETEEQD